MSNWKWEKETLNNSIHSYKTEKYHIKTNSIRGK